MVLIVGGYIHEPNLLHHLLACHSSAGVSLDGERVRVRVRWKGRKIGMFLPN